MIFKVVQFLRLIKNFRCMVLPIFNHIIASYSVILNLLYLMYKCKYANFNLYTNIGCLWMNSMETAVSTNTKVNYEKYDEDNFKTQILGNFIRNPENKTIKIFYGNNCCYNFMNFCFNTYVYIFYQIYKLSLII